jgi:hypothetical protein
MKRLIQISALTATAISLATATPSLQAGNSEWATAGKVLTGVVAGSVLTGILNPHHHCTTVYSTPVVATSPVMVPVSPVQQVVVQQPVQQVIVQARPQTVIVQPAPVPVIVRPAPVVVYQAPVMYPPPYMVHRPPVVGFHFSYGHQRRGHHRW